MWVLPVMLHDRALVGVVAVEPVVRLVRFNVFGAGTLDLAELRTPFEVKWEDRFVVTIAPVARSSVLVPMRLREVAEDGRVAVLN